MFALILKNKIIQLSETKFPVFPELTWIDIKNVKNIKTGMVIDAKGNIIDAKK